MAFIALCVFVALHFFEAGYGYLFDRRYGPPVPNKVGWVLMESPVFIMMWVLWALSDRMWDAVPLTLLAMFQLHYFQRSFIFPLLMRGRSKMPLGIVLMGMVFNTLNALMQGGWIFYFAPEGYYDGWFCKPFIYVGAVLFFATCSRTISYATCARRATRAIIFPAAACSDMFRRPTISVNCWSGRALPWRRCRGRAQYSYGGRLPIWRRVRHRFTGATRRSSARSSPRCTASG